MKRGQDKSGRYNQVLKKLEKKLPKERFAHSLRVVEIARKLAKHYCADLKKTELAALLHDCSRFLTRKGMLNKAKELKWKIDKSEEAEPKLLHAGLSAYFAEHNFGIKDKEILSAIKSHTVGNTSMSLIDKIIYLADHIEEARDYKEVSAVKKLAFENLDQAVIESLSSMIRFIKSQNLPVSKKSIAARDALIKNG